MSEFERQLADGIEAIVGPRRPVDSMAIARMAASRAPIRTSMLSRVSALFGRGPSALGRRHGDHDHVIWSRRNLTLLLAALVTMALIGGAIGVGSGLLRPPAVVPPYLSPQPTSSPGTSPSATAPARPLGGGLIVAHDFQNQHDGPFDVFLIDAGSGERTRVGTLPGLNGRAYAFQWSPDRSHILIPDALGPLPALQAPTEAAKAYSFICCKDLHGAGRWVLSPPGDRIAGTRDDDRGQRALEIVVLDVDGNGTVRLPLPTGVGAVGNGVSWAPDGSAVVIEGCRPCNVAGFGQRQNPVAHYHLFIVPIDGSPVRELLDDTGGGPGAPAWSPDGSSIAVVRLICDPGTVMPFCGGAPGVLETVQVANGAVKRMGNVGPAGFAPVWSPDGRRIAYTDDTGLFVIGEDGTGLTRLVGGDATHAQWSPDGSRILFRSVNSLSIVPSDGGESRLVGPYPGGAW